MQSGLSFIFLSKNDFDKMLPEVLKDVPKKINSVDYHEEDKIIEFYFNNKQERKKYVEEKQNILLYYLFEGPVPIPFEPKGRFVFGYIPERFYLNLSFKEAIELK